MVNSAPAFGKVQPMEILTYTEIYNMIYHSMKSDQLDDAVCRVAARRITDAIWSLHLSLNFGKEHLQNTVKTVKQIVEGKLHGNPLMPD